MGHEFVFQENKNTIILQEHEEQFFESFFFETQKNDRTLFHLIPSHSNVRFSKETQVITPQVNKRTRILKITKKSSILQPKKI